MPATTALFGYQVVVRRGRAGSVDGDVALHGPSRERGDG